MKSFCGYDVSEDVFEFIQGIIDYIETNFGFAISSSKHYIYIDPIEDHVIVKCDERPIEKYASAEELLINFEIDEKKLIELLEDFDYA